MNHHKFYVQTIILVLVLMLPCQVKSSTQVILECSEPGKLKLTTEALIATQLKIIGRIDARDFQTLKKVTLNRTRELDLSDAIIEAYSGKEGCFSPAGSDWIISGDESMHIYPANTFPIHAFTETRDNSLHKWREGSSTLRKLILPVTLTGFEPDAISANSWLTQIIVPNDAQFLVGNGYAVYTSDYKKLVVVAPGYTEHLDIPATVEKIDSCAFNNVRFTYVKFNSDKIPDMPGCQLLDAAFLIVPSINSYVEMFPNIDCIEKRETIFLSQVSEGHLIEELGNMGYTRETVREVSIVGQLNQEDLSDLFSLPNLHYADLSGSTTSAGGITLPKGRLCQVKLPSGHYYLNVEEDNYLTGELNIPEGVYNVSFHNKRYKSVKFPSTLIYLTDNSFSSSLIQYADFSLCNHLDKISGFSSCPHLKHLLLPPSLKTLEDVTNAAIENMDIPESLTTLSWCSGWDITSLRLPSSLERLEYFSNMPYLESVDASACCNLVYLNDVFNNCPRLESIDLSCSPIDELSGFNGSLTLSGVASSYSGNIKSLVVSGTTHFPAPGFSGLKRIKLPSSISSINGFENCEKLESLLLSHCYRLTQLSGVRNCVKLDTLALPPSIEKLCLFEGCTSLRAISIAALTPPDFQDNEECVILSDATVTIPNGRLGIYRMSKNWSHCKNFIEGGYTVSIKTNEDINLLIDGAGLYKSGDSVILSDHPRTINQLQDYGVNSWIINEIQDAESSFMITTHCDVLACIEASHPDKEKAEILIELIAPVDTVFEIILEGDPERVELYDDNGLLEDYLYNSFIQLHAGKNTFYAVGKINNIYLNIDYNTNNKVILSSLSFNNKEYVENIIAPYMGITELDVKGLTGLEMLDIHGNQIKSLDLSESINLRFLDCSDNLMKTMDLAPETPTDQIWLDNNCMAFSSMTPHVYELLEKKGYLQIYYKVDKEEAYRGVIDLSHELYSKSGVPTEFLLYGTDVWIDESNSDGIYHLGRGTYYLEMKNSEYPELVYYGDFVVTEADKTSEQIFKDLSIRIDNGHIYVEGLRNRTLLEIVSLDGKELDRTYSVDGEAHLKVAKSQICVLKLRSGNAQKNVKLLVY